MNEKDFKVLVGGDNLMVEPRYELKEQGIACGTVVSIGNGVIRKFMKEKGGAFKRDPHSGKLKYTEEVVAMRFKTHDVVKFKMEDAEKRRIRIGDNGVAKVDKEYYVLRQDAAELVEGEATS